MSNPITVQTSINAPAEKVWQYLTAPEHITHWAFASADWEAPHAENDVTVGGKFLTRMQAKDGSSGFDFTGTYTAVEPNKLFEYDMSDGRHVKTELEAADENSTTVTQTFDPETENPEEFQRQGWQAILDNFKRYVESN